MFLRTEPNVIKLNVRNFRFIKIKLVIVPGRLYQRSLMFAGKVGNANFP